MYRCITILFLAIWTPYSVHAQLALNTTDGLPDLGRSSSVWADFNNDGWLDVALSGINAAGTKQAGVFINNNNGSFSNSGIGLIAISDGDMAVNDYNQDGKMDLLLTGVDAGNAKVTRLYKNEGNAVFTIEAASFEGVAYGGCVFTDLNNDGKPDVLINGLNHQNQSVTLLYRNNANGTFTLQTSPLVGTSYGDVLVFDVNNDSFSDLLISGLNGNNQRVMELYVNKGSFTFVKATTTLPALRSGSMSSADINNDGYTDLFITGSSSGSNNHTAVYLNNAGAGFTLLQSFPGLSEGAGTWGDYNNDGFTDLAFFGFDKTNLVASVFNNVAGTSFVDSSIPLPGASQGLVHWVDYNKDNRLDLLLSGYSGVPFTSLYTHEVSSTNTLPSAPSHLKSTAYADSIVLSWDAAADPETTVNGLTYSVYIGSTAGATDVLNPLANIANGLRKIKGTGSVEHTYLVVPKLAQGTYYWGVQAIDAAYGASAFSNEAIAVSCAPVKISGLPKVCLNTSLVLQAGEPSDQVSWYSVVNKNQVGTGLQLHHTLKIKDTLVAKVMKPLGCILYDTLAVDVLPLPVVNAGEDKKNCLLKEVELQATSAESPVVWYERGTEETVLFTGALYHPAVTKEQDLVVRVQNKNGCIGRDTVHVGLYGQPVANIGSDKQGCKGLELSWTAGTATDSVNWYSQQKGVLLKNQFDLSLKLEQNDKLWVEVFSNNRCVSYDTIGLTAFNLPVADAGEDQLICAEASATIGDAMQSTSGLTFLWNPSQSLSATDAAAPLASPLTNTKYIVLVKDQNNCENRDTVWVYLNPSTIVNAGENRPVCTGSSVVIGGNPTASGSTLPYSYHWSPALGLNDVWSSNPTASPLETTTYTLQVKAGECIAGSSVITITVNPLPTVYAGEDVIIGAEQSVTLSVAGADTYEWFPQELFTDATSLQPLVSPNRSTAYRVQGKDLNGCLNTDTVMVTVRSELFVPALFTPNGDDVNNNFRAHGFGVKNISLKVYDRWGRMLFHSSDLEQAWDGRFDGQPVESGNYVWTVEGEFFDGDALHCKGQKRGIVKLIR